MLSPALRLLCASYSSLSSSCVGPVSTLELGERVANLRVLGAVGHGESVALGEELMFDTVGIRPLEGLTTVSAQTAEESSGCGFVFFLPIVALLSGTVALWVNCVLPGVGAIGMNGSSSSGNKGEVC